MQAAQTHKKNVPDHFEALFVNATMGIIITDDSKKIAAVNPFALKEFGYKEEELLGREIEMLIPGRFRNSHAIAHDKYFENPKTRQMGPGLNLYALKKDGSEFPVEISLSHYKHANSNYVLAFINNISDRKKWEAEIEELNAHLENTVERRTRDLKNTLRQLEFSNTVLRDTAAFQKALLENAGAIIISTDRNGVIKTFNPAAEKLLGYTADEVCGKETPVIFHCPVETKKRARMYSKELDELIEPGFETYIAKAKKNIIAEEEWTYVRKDGSSFPVSLTVAAMHKNTNEISGYVGVAVDISERKKTEREIIAAKEMLAGIITNYPDGSISVVDKNFSYIFVGGEALRVLELNSQDLIGKRLFPFLEQQDWKTVETELKKVFAGKKITDMEMPVMIKGHLFTFDAFPLKEPGGAIEKIAVMSRNISELKKAEDDLREALKRERELGELKSRFVTTASHEFRTPLSTILSSAYLIEQYEAIEDQPKRQKHLKRIISSVNMLTDILNDFLSVGKIEEGKLTAKPEIINLKEMILAVADEMKPALKARQEVFCYHDGNEEITLDPGMTKHIIMNLLSNAGKFSPENGKIEIRTSVSDNQTSIAVKDYGIGISRQDQEHLMERFFRGSNATNIQGTGLGLHIVAKYAEFMNGKVAFRSELEKGTEFIVTFPAGLIQ